MITPASLVASVGLGTGFGMSFTILAATNRETLKVPTKLISTTVLKVDRS